MADLKNNPTFTLNAINDTAFVERPVPQVGPNEVLVEVKKTGLCGSDVHYWQHGRIGDFIVEKPMVLGHESSGIIHTLGSEVSKRFPALKPGVAVALEPGASCGSCDACRKGRYQLCPDMVFAATPPYDGTLARYYKLPAHLAYPLPEHVSLEEGAMMEPLSVGVHSVSTLGELKPNQSVTIFGAGPVGLLCAAVARALGAKRVILVDIVQSRLDFALKYAATDVFLPPKPQEGESKIAFSRRVVGIMKEQLGIEERGEKGIDLVLDASGAEVCIQMGFYLVKIGGTFIQVGMGAPEITVPITTFMTKELKIRGSFRYGAGDYELAIALVGQGKIDVKSLITHRFPFTDALKAFDTNRSGTGPDGKGVIKAIIDGPL